MEISEIIILTLSAVIPLLAFGYYWDAEIRRQRLALISNWLEKQGLELASNYERYGADLFAGAKFFSHRDWSRIYNVFTGDFSGRGFWFFELKKTRENRSRSRRQNNVKYHSVLVFELETKELDLFIRPEDPAERRDILNTYTNDIDFESTEFSDAFHVESPDRKQAYQIITPAVMQLLLGHPSYFFEYSGRYLMLWDEKKWDEAGFEQALALGKSLVSLVPGYMRKENYE